MKEYTLAEDVAKYCLPDGYAIPSKEEMTRLVVLAKAGDGEAYELVVKGTLKYIIRESAAKLKSMPYIRHVTIGDLIGESVLAIDRSIKKFDPGHGGGFLSYAKHWIDNYMREVLMDNGTPGASNIRIAKKKIMAVVRDGVDINDYNELARETGLPFETICSTLAVRSVVSMESLVTEDGLTIGDRVADGSASHQEKLGYEDRRRFVRKALRKLDSKAGKVISMRFGLDGEPMRRNKIGDEIGCCEENVRQIEIRALAELRDDLAAMGMMKNQDI